MSDESDVLPGLRFDGTLDGGPDARAEAATDFGGIVSRAPRAVLRPGSADDIATALKAAADQHLPVVARGRGHTSLGQAQTDGGLVVDLASLDHVHAVHDDHAIVDAGTTWARLLQATLARGLTPRVLTDYLGTSIGGTLSVGGIGGTSHQHGVQTDNVLSLDIVTGDGTLRTCSPTDSPDLFHAVLAGYGRCGIITRATILLVPAPARVRRYKIYYPTIDRLLTQQRKLLHERRFDFLQGEVLPAENGWQYMLDAAAYYTPPNDPDDTALLHELGYEPARDKTEDLTYWEFADRLADTVTYLEQTGEWSAPHPWPNLLLPDHTTDEFLHHILRDLTHADLGASGLILLYPIFTRPLTTPLFRTPDAPVVFLIAALRFTPPTGPVTLDDMVASNRRWYDQAVQLGGTAYPTGAIPFTENDWKNHHGPAHDALEQARQRYDPQGLLRPGLIAPTPEHAPDAR